MVVSLVFSGRAVTNKCSQEVPDAPDTCTLSPGQSDCHPGEWRLVEVVSISTGIHGDYLESNVLPQWGHLSERSLAMPSRQCDRNRSGLVAVASTLICDFEAARES